MYDAILISTHYNYSDDGSSIPDENTGEYEDLSMIIPLGIIHIAQYLYDCGFRVRVVHIPHEVHFLRRFGIDPNGTENLIEMILKEYPARVCGIQAHWYLYCGGAIFISRLYKRLFPESKIFLGGYMATACWREFLELSKDIDGMILGEGEKTLKVVLEKVLQSRDCDLNDVNGVAFRSEKNEVIYNPPNETSVLGLHEIPIIHPDSAPFRNILWQKRHYINISRGLCPEKCSYCVGNNKEINTRTYQTLKMDKTLEQIRVYEDFGFHDLFLGENHFLNMPLMKELVEGIAKEDFKLNFELEAHPLTFENQALLEKMIQARFWRFTMGCESGSDSLLRRVGRSSTARQIVESTKRIADSGAIVLTSWISNLPGETQSEFQETQEVMRQVVKVGGFIYWIENLHVLPGSELYEKPEYWNIDILLTKLEDWVRWSILSKRYVPFEEAHEDPLDYLTHLNRNASPEGMIKRFYSNRKFALSLTPQMKLNLKTKFKNLPSEILETEMKALEWYENNGSELWLF
jgi:radical SAM superfamily enzyme YgiQ (UPF0313 family)